MKSATSLARTLATPRAIFAAATFVLFAPLFASPAHAADACDPHASSGYRYDMAMNGGYAGGSTQPRNWTCNTQAAGRDNSSNGYKYDQAMNGGYAGGSTAGRTRQASLEENTASSRTPVQQ